MPKFIVVHHAVYEELASIDHLVELSKQMRDTAPPGLRWLNSWWSPEQEVLFCEWEADQEEHLREHLALVCTAWPTDKIYPVIWVDPGWYA